MNALKELFLFTIVVLFSCTLLSSCSDDEDDNNTPQNAERTVIVYMVAENNLNINCESDLDEMTTGARNINKNANLIVYVDKLSKTEKPYIARISADGMKKVRVYEEDDYACDPKVMTEAMQWIIKNYPAKSYGLVVWGHADGWFIRGKEDSFAKGNNLQTTNAKPLSILPDNGTDSGKSRMMLNVSTFRNEVLSTLPHFDYIFFDCCNMQTAEVDYELRNVCDLIIASPAEIPAEGAPYEKVVGDLFLPIDQLGKMIVDDYINYTNFDKGSGVPLSVVKTSNMEALAQATMEALKKFRNDFTYPVEPSVSQCIYYYKYEYTYYFNAMYDLRDLMFRNLSTEDFARWDDIFQKTVTYSVHPEKKWPTEFEIQFNDFVLADDNFGGMSMFVPRKDYSRNQYDISPNIRVMEMEWTKVVDWSLWGWGK